ncbi:MAG: GtrA family protein [Acidimicrobiaceae bacterium]|nr:GtrA family protein [Acidimicrobiaceae bacterium]
MSSSNDSQTKSRHAWGPAWLYQFLRFVTVGLINTAVELIVYNALLAIHNPHSLTILTLYSTLGVCAAIVNSYLWNSRWAFRGQSAQHGRSAVRQRVLFIVQALVNIGINDAVTVGLTPGLTSLDLIPRVAAQNLAKVLAMCTSSVSSYLMLRWFVFTPDEDDEDEAPAETKSPAPRIEHPHDHSMG